LERFRVAGFQDRCLQPLGHSSVFVWRTIIISLRLVKHRAIQLLYFQSINGFFYLFGELLANFIPHA
ncbi:hypothetical protein, partial [Plesiomonas shigelloides]|uniref:hypothetical protein n=1 Tax=Plesiomonas shigelloides TaxID=703 RepID=UPI001C49A60C